MQEAGCLFSLGVVRVKATKAENLNTINKTTSQMEILKMELTAAKYSS